MPEPITPKNLFLSVTLPMTSAQARERAVLLRQWASEEADQDKQRQFRETAIGLEYLVAIREKKQTGRW